MMFIIFFVYFFKIYLQNKQVGIEFIVIKLSEAVGKNLGENLVFKERK